MNEKKINILHYVDGFGDFEMEKELCAMKLEDFYPNAEITHTNDFEDVKELYKYDIVFFDYGGLDLPGASILFDDHERIFMKEIEENKNTIFCIISQLPPIWADREIGETFPNLFIGWESLEQIKAITP